MKFFKLFKKFENAEDGAVTVDWVVLTAAVVGLGLAALAAKPRPERDAVFVCAAPWPLA